jgi:hypothetical protein
VALVIHIEPVDGGKKEKDSPEVAYMGPKDGPFQCGNCEYFKTPSACAKVEGEIAPKGCCNLFEKRARES